MHVMVQQTLLFGYHSFVPSWGKKLPKTPQTPKITPSSPPKK